MQGVCGEFRIEVFKFRRGGHGRAWDWAARRDGRDGKDGRGGRDERDMGQSPIANRKQAIGLQMADVVARAAGIEEIPPERTDS